MTTITINGLDKLSAALAQYANKVNEGVKAAVARAANDIADAAKQNAHGAVAGSIQAEISADGVSAIVSANSKYAVFAEYGVNIPAIKAENAKALHFIKNGEDVFVKSAQAHPIAPRPFLNPAAEHCKPEFIERIKNSIINI